MQKQLQRDPRNIQDKVAFIAARQHFQDEGYPLEIADQYAWDCFFAGRGSN